MGYDAAVAAETVFLMQQCVAEIAAVVVSHSRRCVFVCMCVQT